MFAQLSVQYCMFIGTSLTWHHWDAGSTISEWQPKHRPAISDRPSSSPTATARHGTNERRLKRSLLLAHSRPYVHRNWIFFQSRPRSRPNNKTKLLSDIRDAPTTRHQVREMCRFCHWHCHLRLSRHACADLPMVEKLETFLTISDDDNGNFIKCCHDDVLYRREQYSDVIVNVHEQCCHMDSERVVSNDR